MKQAVSLNSETQRIRTGNSGVWNCREGKNPFKNSNNTCIFRFWVHGFSEVLKAKLQHSLQLRQSTKVIYSLSNCRRYRHTKRLYHSIQITGVFQLYAYTFLFTDETLVSMLSYFWTPRCFADSKQPQCTRKTTANRLYSTYWQWRS